MIRPLHRFLLLPPLTLSTAITAPQESTYDYIIIGGGTAGLTVATRLSENPSLSILVIESSDSQLENPDVTDISRLAYTYDSPLDWAYATTEQGFGGRRQVMRAGRALGGTSAMNGAAYARAERIQLDALHDLSNTQNWSWSWPFTWEGMLPYYKKSETVRAPNASQIAAGASVVPEFHGDSGPVQVNFTTTLNRTLATLGVPWNRDLNSGSMRGFALHPYTIDSDGVRSDAAAAYYRDISDRRNLHVWVNASATKILWKDSAGEPVSAPHRVHARREVVLAAGAMRSSGILELSGVGNPSILEKQEIPPLIPLRSVGENLQDQLNTSIVFTTKRKITGTRSVAFITASDLFGPETNSISKGLLTAIPAYAETIATNSNGAITAESLITRFESQHDLIFKHNVPIGEYVFILDNPTQVHVGYWGLLPFSRGSVHVSSGDPAAPPTLDPGFGMLEWDVQVQIAMLRFLRKVLLEGELGEIFENEVIPGLDRVPEHAGDEVWMDWIGEQYTPNYHAVGSTSMLPTEMGGVIDDRFTVYGTRNVRVVDASIFPIQLCGHPTANIYAFAERAANVIKEDAVAFERGDIGGLDVLA
ncbi:hypothetical protein BJY00DRAFT_303529 [Aspergillus carlsbadensis]|nr:hypothetical protein BJY00DRAFT_303529 [Aspergillus carlsbadensis]